MFHFSVFTFLISSLLFCFLCQKNGLPLSRLFISCFSLSLLYSIFFSCLTILEYSRRCGDCHTSGDVFPSLSCPPPPSSSCPIYYIIILSYLIPPFISNIYTNTHDKVSEQLFPWYCTCPRSGEPPPPATVTAFILPHLQRRPTLPGNRLSFDKET